MPPGAGEPAGTAPAAYTPPHLAARIIAARHGLEGERKQVTVLFADLTSSLQMLADRDPEEVRRLLDPVLERMMEAVHRYEGTVNQVMGDGIMALFGAPVALEDHALRACYAALSMQAAIGRYGDEVRRTQGVPIQIRVGINSGEVVVRSIGNDLRMDYSAVGQTTHLAARMEQAATPGSVLLTADTLRLAEGFVEVRPLGPVAVKGLPEPIEVYELAGASTERTRLEARAARGLSPLVGRDGELAQVARALELARAGRGQVVALVGEAGVGKSRLGWEVLRSHRTAGWLVIEASAVPYGAAVPFLPIRQLLRRYLGIEEGEEPRRMREKLIGKVLGLDESLRPALPALLDLLELPPGDDRAAPPDPASRHRRITDAVRRVLGRESQVQPLLLLIEDLQWVDDDTQRLLDELVEGLPAARALLLVNYRPDYRHGWGSRSHYSQVRLDPLGPAPAGLLVASLLGDDPSLDPARAMLIERTQGNPFFLEECARALVETGALVGERGAYRAARPLQHLQMPATVQALLAARIDRLPAEDKEVVHTAAVIGKEFPLAVLEAIAEPSADAVAASLARLQGAELVYQARLFPAVEYTFKHALTHEAAYGSLLHERRRALHARVVEAIERLHPDRVAGQADLLAHHAFRGEVWGKALVYLRQAVAESSQWSLDAVMGSPQSAGQLWWTGQHERAIKTAERELAVAASFGNFGMRVTASCRLGQAHHARGEYRRAAEVFRQVVASLTGSVATDSLGMAALPAVFARNWLGWCLAETGDLAEACAVTAESLAMAEAADQPYSLMHALWARGGVEVLRGEPGSGAVLLERGLVVGRVAGISLLHPFLAAPLGLAYAHTGRAADGIALLEEARARAADMRLVAGRPLWLTWLGRARLAAGQRDAAQRLAVEAAELADQQGERGHWAHALHLAADADALTSGPDAEPAREAYRRALEVAEALEMRPLRAHCQLGLGRLLRRAGLEADAARHLAAAEALYAELGAPAWVEAARAAGAGAG